MGMTTSTSSNHPSPTKNPTEAALWLLDSVYGSVDSPDFPLPMPSEEAGLCYDGYQRRYLWTDAFGVMAYISLAEQAKENGNTEQQQKYQQAADKLITVVHDCLGKPRSNKENDQMEPDTTSPTGYVGLRIGKVSSRKVTDYGMRYDGQYWHYIDKWLLALSRAGHTHDGIAIAKSVFPYFFDAGPQGTGHHGGIRWKLSVDATPPPELQYSRSGANDDTLVALIVFSMLEEQRTEQLSAEEDNKDTSANPSLSNEIALLQQSLQGYKPRVTDDPLGWGLEAMYDQFLYGQPRQSALVSLHSHALHISHLSLPFRLYGAMIGAQIVGANIIAPTVDMNHLIEQCMAYEANAIQRGYEEHSSINRVMLATVLLCPGCLKRRPNDPSLNL